MSTLTVSPDQRIPVGSTLDLYRYHDATRPPSMPAVQSAIEMAAGGLTLSGLVPDTAYVLGGMIGGVWRGVAMRTPKRSIDAVVDFIGGRVASGGTAESGGGFAVETTGTGLYTVLYDAPFDFAPALGVAIRGTSLQRGITVPTDNADGFTVRIFSTVTGGGAQNHAWSFTAMAIDFS